MELISLDELHSFTEFVLVDVVHNSIPVLTKIKYNVSLVYPKYIIYILSYILFLLS